MPELPEAETIVRGLVGPLTGVTLGPVHVIHADVVQGDPDGFARRLEGCRIEGVGRRGKNIVLRLDGDLRLVVNLGMSGRLLLRIPQGDDPPPSHPAVRAELLPATTGTLVYHDIRRFGHLQILDPEGWTDFSGRMGPEPLGPDFTAAWLADALSTSRMPLRSWLLDQRKLAGVGNIYASEAAWRARIHPARRVLGIGNAEATRLHRALVDVLEEAVEARGTTLRDYRTAQGWEGSFGASLGVYGRKDEPCQRCGTPIRRIVFSNRSAFFCPTCQPPDGSVPRSAT